MYTIHANPTKQPLFTRLLNRLKGRIWPDTTIECPGCLGQGVLILEDQDDAISKTYKPTPLKKIRWVSGEHKNALLEEIEKSYSPEVAMELLRKEVDRGMCDYQRDARHGECCPQCLGTRRIFRMYRHNQELRRLTVSELAWIAGNAAVLGRPWTVPDHLPLFTNEGELPSATVADCTMEPRFMNEGDGP